MSTSNIESIGGASSTAALRRMNRESLINLLGHRAMMTRAQLAEETGLTTAAISRITREMLEAGVLIETGGDKPAGRVGRRETHLSVNPLGAFVLAISLNANRRGVTLANALGEVIAARDCDDLDPTSPREFLDALAARAKALIYDADFNRSRLLGVGVAATVTGGVSNAGVWETVTSNPLGWRDVPVGSILSDALGLPVRVEHRASALLRAELKVRSEPSDIYLVNVALGIGVSAYLQGRFIASGSHGFGSVSHLCLPEDKTMCDCGRRGCLEVTAAGRAILKSLGHKNIPLVAQSQLLNEAVQSADTGDAATSKAFREAGRRLGTGIDAVIALFTPKTIILAGEVGRQADYLAGVMETLQARGRKDAGKFIERSTITSANAAISVALQEYVFTGELNLKKLTAA